MKSEGGATISQRSLKFDSSLKFDAHIKELSRKVNQKVHTFGRLRPFLGGQKAKLLFNSVIMSSFSYCPLIWLFCSKGANNEINRTQKRALRALYGDSECTFEELLDKGKSMTIHKKSLQRLMVEIYKTINHLNHAYMWKFFIKEDVPYNFRSKNLCKIPSVNSQLYGISSLSFRGRLLWNALSDEVKLATSINNFKRKYNNGMEGITSAIFAHT